MGSRNRVKIRIKVIFKLSLLLAMNNNNPAVLLELSGFRVIAAHPRELHTAGSKCMLSTELDDQIWIWGVL